MNFQLKAFQKLQFSISCPIIKTSLKSPQRTLATDANLYGWSFNAVYWTAAAVRPKGTYLGDVGVERGIRLQVEVGLFADVLNDQLGDGLHIEPRLNCQLQTPSPLLQLLHTWCMLKQENLTVSFFSETSSQNSLNRSAMGPTPMVHLERWSV